MNSRLVTQKVEVTLLITQMAVKRPVVLMKRIKGRCQSIRKNKKKKEFGERPRHSPVRKKRVKF
jgi:hypothetical protein